jgi:hypothetical protein
MTEEQILYCENRFKYDKHIIEEMKNYNYSILDKGWKTIFWQTIVNKYLLETYNYKVPVAKPKPVTIQSLLEKKEYSKKVKEENEKNLTLSIQQLKDYNIKRIYKIESSSGNRICSVLDALPVVKRRCKYSGSLGGMVKVTYYPAFANFEAIQFTSSTVGLYTTFMTDCIGVMFLFGKIGRGTDFTHGSLVHLPGGDSAGLNWKKMVFNLSPTQLRSYIQIEVLYAQALICVTPDRLAGSETVYNLIKNEIIPLGFNFPQIMVYIGDVPGFAIHKSGCFGIVEK